MSDDEAEPSQRYLNEDMLKDGDIQVETAPIMQGLKPAERPRELVRRDFKPPRGFEAHLAKVDPAVRARLQMGMRRQFKPLLPKPFIKSNFTPPLAPTAEELKAIQEAAAAEEAQKLLAKAEAEAALQAARAAFVPTSAPKLPADYTPLCLYQAADHEDDPDAADVVVDDIVGQYLRQHQREGVGFVFNCTHGLVGEGINGCILADDMGLGKTLQSITLLHTVLKQGIKKGVPTARRAIVVCPTSLVNNWRDEIKKWVGDRIRPMPIAEATKEEASRDINLFLQGHVYPVLIISYETFRIHASKFHAREDACDLLICDEAHRLKNEATLTNQALAKLNCKRRILLSGTPMQNDLDEFFAMVDFTNPGILGDVSNFRRKFATPILAGREPSATEKAKAAGEEASAELSNIVNKFILRRTNTLLSKHLPPKLLQVVCVNMVKLQRELYEAFLQSGAVSGLLTGKATGVLSSITALRKLINHPRLLCDVIRQKEANGGKLTGEAAGLEAIRHKFPAGWMKDRSSVFPEVSGKFLLAARMLNVLRSTTKDRIVIVSCYTQTLDLFGKLCTDNRWPYIRLDGSTSAGKRQKLVDQFNDQARDEFVFLLSSKAGGCGLNLVGGNRLILFDPDWNPATDLQAAARVWRDGQRKKVFVYRFLATGTLEEKVFQRQLSKKGLQTIVVEEGDEVNALSTEDLRNLFQYEPDTPSDTHDMLRCPRCRKDEVETGGSDGEMEAQRREDEEERHELKAKAATRRAAKAEEAEAAAATAGADGAGASSSSSSAAAGASFPCGKNSSGKAGKGSKSAAAGGGGGVSESKGDDDDDGDEAMDGAGHRHGKPCIDLAGVDTADDEDTRDTFASRKSGRSKASAATSKSRVSSAAGASNADSSDSDSGSSSDSDSDSSSSSSSSSSSGSSSSSSNSSSVVVADGDDDDSDADGGGAGAGAKRKRGGSKKKLARKKKPLPSRSKKQTSKKKAADKGPSKAALRRAEKAAKKSQKEEDDVYRAEFKEARQLKRLAPVAPGTVRRQLKQPQEDEIKNWSHHMGCTGIAEKDSVLSQCGQDLVSFVFGLEVPGRDLVELNQLLDQKAKDRAAQEAREKREKDQAERAAMMAHKYDHSKFVDMTGWGDDDDKKKGKWKPGMNNKKPAVAAAAGAAGAGSSAHLGSAGAVAGASAASSSSAAGAFRRPSVGVSGAFKAPQRLGLSVGGSASASSSSASAFKAPQRLSTGSASAAAGGRPVGIYGARPAVGGAGAGVGKGRVGAGGPGGKAAKAKPKPKKRSKDSDDEDEVDYDDDDDEEEEEEEEFEGESDVEEEEDDEVDDGDGDEEMDGHDENAAPPPAAAPAAAAPIKAPSSKPAPSAAPAAGNASRDAPRPAQFGSFLGSGLTKLKPPS